jgi:hypothetical protein
VTTPRVKSAVSPDAAALLILVLFAVAVTLWAAGDPIRFTGGDWPTQYLPWYAFLGERLRAGDVPAWNPHQFAGAPFAGDPNSGWAYLPSMILYTLFSPEAATTAFVGVHLLLSGLATYLLARVLRLSIAGALVAGIAAMAPWTLLAVRQLPYVVGVTSWIPAALLGAELAILARKPLPRLGGWALAGLAVSQLLGVWLGKGAYYGVLALGGWIAYRTLIVPDRPAPLRERISQLVLHGAAVLLIGVGLGAAGALPRLEANPRSTIPAGVYDDAIFVTQPDEAWSPGETILRLGGGTNQSRLLVGAATLALAALAPFVARGWLAAPYFTALALAALVLTWDVVTPLHAALFTLLPWFARVHTHDPAGIAMLIPLPATLLAGATVSVLTNRQRVETSRWLHGTFMLIVLVLLLAVVGEIDLSLPVFVLITIGALVAMAMLLPTGWRGIITPAFMLVILWQPFAELMEKELGPDPSRWGTVFRAHGEESVAFLIDNPVAAAVAAFPGGPHRYIGYDPALLPPPESDVNAYRAAANQTGLSWLLVNNWATWFDIDTSQGYNALQVKRYVAFVRAMNGHRQEYHGGNVFPSGLASPLFSLLNVRYLIVPAGDAERPDLDPLLAAMPTVYADEHARILEYAGAYPRAWLVHEARRADPSAALALLTTGTVDPGQTALLETEPPPLGILDDADSETVSWIGTEPDRLSLRVEVNAPALLVLSEVWDPNWTATVDGEPAPVVLADYTLRAVSVPPGAHEVVLSYEPHSLRLGLAVTLITAVLLVVAALSLSRHGPALQLATLGCFRQSRTGERRT